MPISISVNDRGELCPRLPVAAEKTGVAIHWRMRGTQRPRHAVMRHDGETLGFGLRQRRVGGDDGNGRIFRRVALDTKVERARWPGRWPAEAAKLAIFFIGGGPEMRPVADRRSGRAR